MEHTQTRDRTFNHRAVSPQGEPYSKDGRTVTYDSEAGVKAMEFFTSLLTEHKVSEIGFLTDGQTAFKAGKAGMTIDGSFRLAAFNGQRGLEYAIGELPAHDGQRFNFSSYWVNGITAKAEGEKRVAAAKFLAFITRPEAMQLWLDTVGELIELGFKSVSSTAYIRTPDSCGSSFRYVANLDLLF